MLYMFRAVPPPIIRSSRTVHTPCMCQACLLLPLAAAASKMEGQCVKRSFRTRAGVEGMNWIHLSQERENW